MTTPHRIPMFSTAVAIATAFAACTATAPDRAPTVTFVLDAPLCSSILHVQLHIDGALVATDTFRTFGVRDTASQAFNVSAGSHRLAANVIGGFVWPEKQVSLGAGQAYTDTLSFYCS